MEITRSHRHLDNCSGTKIIEEFILVKYMRCNMHKRLKMVFKEILRGTLQLTLISQILLWHIAISSKDGLQERILSEILGNPNAQGWTSYLGICFALYCLDPVSDKRGLQREQEAILTLQPRASSISRSLILTFRKYKT